MDNFGYQFGSGSQHHYNAWQTTPQHYDPYASAWPHNPLHSFDDPQDFLSISPLMAGGPAPVERFLRDSHRPWNATGDVNLQLSTHHLPPPAHCEHTIQHPFTSPYMSGTPSTDYSTERSENHSTPWSSPAPSADDFSPHNGYIDAPLLPFGGGDGCREFDRVVSLNEVQYRADEQPDQMILEDDEMQYFHQPIAADEGYVPSEDQSADEVHVQQGAMAAVAESRSQSPTARRRSQQSTRSVTSPRLPSSGVTKRPTNTRRASSSSTKSGSTNKRSDGPFLCIFKQYGCEMAFGQKNEWKRHVLTQHMKPDFWRCDQCPVDADRPPNEFNRKDLFREHLRRMHKTDGNKTMKAKSTNSKSSKKKTEDNEWDDVTDRCRVSRRVLPLQSGCNFCERTFNGPNSWEERMEHVGTHLEQRKGESTNNNSPMEVEGWRDDEILHEYLVKHTMIEQRGKGWELKTACK